jgi:phage shock protein E
MILVSFDIEFGRFKVLRYLRTTMGFVIVLISACATPMPEESKAVWVDVRSPSEYQQSSINGHPNIPHGEITEQISALARDKDTPIYLYCRSGGRAGKAKTALEDMGYTHVTNAGGIEDVRESLKSD